MKHRVAGRKLGRTSAHRLAVLRNLSTSLFDKERVTTTLMKAKELRPFAEKLLTLSKRETLHARRLVLRHIHDRDVVEKMFDTLSARYSQRPGGYTRIVKLGARRGDNAEMAIVELVDAEIAKKAEKADEKGAKAGKGAKKDEEAGAAPAETKGAKKTKAKGDDAAEPRKKAAPRKRTKDAAKPAKAESKGKAKSGSAASTRKVGKSGS